MPEVAGTPAAPSLTSLAGVPNLQTVVDNTAAFYFNQGVLGGTIVLLLLLLIASCAMGLMLYKALRKQDQKMQELLRDTLTYIAGARDAELATKETLKGVEDTLNGVKDTLALRPQLLSDISHQIELLATDTRHGFSNVGQMGRGVVAAIRDLREMLGLSKRRGDS